MRNGYRGSSHAEHLQVRHAVGPLFPERQGYELGRYERQDEHGGERKECREAQHLAEHAQLPPLAVVSTCQHRLRHRRQRCAYHRIAHGVPFVSLRVKPHLVAWEVVPHLPLQELVVQRGEYVGCENLAAE